MNNRQTTENFIFAYENDELSHDQIVEGFQALIDCGLAWNLQGSYGRMTTKLIKEGLCTPQACPCPYGDNRPDDCRYIDCPHD